MYFFFLIRLFLQPEVKKKKIQMNFNAYHIRGELKLVYDLLFSQSVFWLWCISLMNYPWNSSHVDIMKAGFGSLIQHGETCLEWQHSLSLSLSLSLLATSVHPRSSWHNKVRFPSPCIRCGQQIAPAISGFSPLFYLAWKSFALELCIHNIVAALCFSISLKAPSV